MSAIVTMVSHGMTALVYMLLGLVFFPLRWQSRLGAAVTYLTMLVAVILLTMLPGSIRVAANLVVYIAWGQVFFRGKWFRKLLVTMLSIFLAIFSETAAAFLLKPSLDVLITGSRLAEMDYGLFSLLVGGFMLVGLVLIRQLRWMNDSRVPLTVWLRLMAGMLCIVAVIVLLQLRQYGLVTMNETLLMGGVMVLLMGAILLMTGLVRYVSRVEEARWEAENRSLREASQLALLTAQIDSGKAMAQLRHDMRNHMAVLRALMAEDPQRAAAYLDETAQQLKPVTWTGHPIIDGLIAAKTADPSVSLKVDAQPLPETLLISDRALTVLVGNALDNAIEAVQRLPKDAQGPVRLSVRVQGDALLVRIANPCAEDFSPDEARRQSSKRPSGAGLGLHAMETELKQLGTYLSFKREGSEAVLMFLIPAALPAEV